jgi:carboxymethylenebutenolidase
VVSTSEPAAVAAEGHLASLPTAYGTHFDAYLAGAADAPVGVLLVPDRWGLNDQVRAWADRIAALGGYRVVAVDLYDGRRARDAWLAQRIWVSIDPVWITADLDAAMDYLQRAQGRIVLVGWGKGVVAATNLIARHPDNVSALVTYYDSETVLPEDRAGKLAVPVLDILTPRTLAGPPAATMSEQARNDAWTATEQFLTRLSQ